MDYFICWTGIAESRCGLRSSSFALTNLMWYSLVKREFMIKLLNVCVFVSQFECMWTFSYSIWVVLPFSGLSSRSPVDTASVHVINIDIQDNHEEATIGAFLFCELAGLVSPLDWVQQFVGEVDNFIHFFSFFLFFFQLTSSEDLDNDIDELLHDFETKCQRPLLHCVLFY